MGNNRPPSAKRAVQGLKILDESEGAGSSASCEADVFSPEKRSQMSRITGGNEDRAANAALKKRQWTVLMLGNGGGAQPSWRPLSAP
jgi:hypothetical protein